MNNTSRTNWEIIDALTDAEIDTSDVPELDDAFFANATWQMPDSPARVVVSVPVDSDVLRWFETQGSDMQTRMRAALRLYVDAHQVAR